MPKSTSEPPIKEWVTKVTTQANLTQQERMIKFLLRAYGALLTVTIAIFCLQGFKLWNFALDPALLKWLGGATVGEIGGLLLLTFKAVFGKQH
jgi:hypothetical protein